MADLFADKPKAATKPSIVATYPYTDENGALQFQCVRFVPKDFRQRRPDPTKPDKWIWNLDGTRRVLYRLPEVVAAVAAGRTVFVVEGEKDCDALAKAGFVATCNPMGAGKWLPEHTAALRGAARVAIIPDRDAPGRKHAAEVGGALHSVVASVRLIELSDREGRSVKDAADWFGAGGTADELRGIVKAASDFVPAPRPEPVTAGSEACESPGEMADRDAFPPSRRPSTATQLVAMANGLDFFHDPQSRAFVRLEANNHTEIWPVNSAAFRDHLAHIFYRHTRSAVNRNAIGDALMVLENRARFDGAEQAVFMRVAPHEGGVVIDLCDPAWRALHITAQGWKVVARSPVPFIRTRAMRPLPEPVSQGSLAPLWALLNVTPDQRPLMAAWLLNALHPQGPYFVASLVGEQGSAKSSCARLMRALVDPSEIPLRSPPREERDLLVQAGNNWCVVLDNLSGLPPWLSDGLCRLSTGGGHSARQLYTDGEEFTVAIKRPVILTGIDDVATRPDLAERALQLELEAIPDERRRPEADLNRQFEQDRPQIFSALVTALSRALRELPDVKLDRLPRMADPALWATAAEPEFGWERGTFMAAYGKNVGDGAVASVEAHPVGLAIRDLLTTPAEWSGEAGDLLATLNDRFPEKMHAPRWPATPRALAVSLRRLAQALRRAGIEVAFDKGKRRRIRLCKRGEAASFASPASASPEPEDGGDAKDANFQALHQALPVGATERQEVAMLL